MTPDIDNVTAALLRAAEELILPRFERLTSSQIELKWTAEDPEDLVTVVDRDVEAFLTNELTALSPGTVVIGEEAAHADPELLRALQTDERLWLLDPLDGTKNFAAGDDRFGLMLSWVVAGRARASWIVLPARSDVFVAEAGSGVRRNGERIGTAPVATGQPRGGLMVRYMPGSVRESVERRMCGRFVDLPPSGCAAIEYTDIARGDRDFVVYYRLHPWDHGAPALMLEEAGGSVVHLDGCRYTVRSGHQITVAARDGMLADDVRAVLAGDDASD
jgi:fructose-1,6-bisphosphatase/inositol monophosphatase family enzyme